MNDEYRIKVSVRNNLLLRAIEDTGCASIKQFCVDNALTKESVYKLIRFETRPLNVTGEFSPAAQQLMEILGAAPSDLWTPEQLELQLTKYSVERIVGQAELNAALGMNQGELISFETPEDTVYAKDKQRVINEMLDSLPPRERKVLELRMGLNGADPQTLDEIAGMFDIHRERVRQIEQRALKKLKHPARAWLIRDFLGE
jgi:RNA polymerase primary sigma factor